MSGEPKPLPRRGLPESPDVKRTKVAIARDEATTRLLDRLTELAEIARHFLEEAIRAEQAEQEENRRRREERLARARQH